LASLFQPFNRLGQQAGSEEGTGIGLVVTKRLTELMGGQIGVTSTPGVGSVFWIDLKGTEPLGSPASGGAARTRSDADGPRETTSKATILYVEDNPANLRLIEELLGFRGDVKLLSAPNANLGIELARAHLPDVILMDLNLPGISGNEALMILRKGLTTRHIPVIAVSANAMPHDIARGRAQGFFRYVVKPIDIDALNEAIDSALELAARRREAKY
jgi:CheY-like chemotaxis protein